MVVPPRRASAGLPSALATSAVGLLVIAILTLGPGGRVDAQNLDDPFAVLNRVRSQQPVRVPPRALAVIPERHTGRRLLLIDELDAFDPQFDDLARGIGLTGASAIQIRTTEARIPVFVPKTETTIATLLQVPLGSNLAITGLLVSRAGRYIFLASDVRPVSQRRRRRR